MSFTRRRWRENGQRRPGKPLTNAAVRLLQQRSMAELVERRVGDRGDQRGPRTRFVSSGGTGSLEVTATDPSVTDIAAGSGFSVVTLFDSYAHFRPLPLSVSGSTWCICRTRHRHLRGRRLDRLRPTGADRLPLPVAGRVVGMSEPEAAGECRHAAQCRRTDRR